MIRLIFIITLLFGLLDPVLLGQDSRPVKIRVAKGYVDKDGRLYQDRVYVDQLEFDLKTKMIYKRKNEAKKFELTEIPFPKLFIDSTTIDKLENAPYIYKTETCKIPIKNFFYKVDVIYCDTYPTIIKTFEINYYPFSNKGNQEKNILEKIVEIYLVLTVKKEK